jgi:hypothetical protein
MAKMLHKQHTGTCDDCNSLFPDSAKDGFEIREDTASSHNVNDNDRPVKTMILYLIGKWKRSRSP